MDLDPLVSGSGIIDPDSDPAKNEIADNKNVISNFIVNSGLCNVYIVLKDCSTVCNGKCQIQYRYR